MPINPNDPEYQLTLTVPSNYSNRAYVVVDNGVVRLSFGEAPVGQPSRYHSAVTLSVADALSLADAIYRTYRAAYPPQPDLRTALDQAIEGYSPNSGGYLSGLPPTSINDLFGSGTGGPKRGR